MVTYQLESLTLMVGDQGASWNFLVSLNSRMAVGRLSTCSNRDSSAVEEKEGKGGFGGMLTLQKIVTPSTRIFCGRLCNIGAFQQNGWGGSKDVSSLIFSG